MGNQLQRNFGILGSCFGSLTGVGIVAFNSSISITNIFGNAFVIGSSGLIGSFIGVALGAGISYLLVRYQRKSQQLQPLEKTHDLQIITFTKEQIDQILSQSSDQYKKLVQNYRCFLTGELIKQCVSLSCSHIFQKRKIQEYVKMNNKCPICYRPAKLKDIRKDRSCQETIQFIRKKNMKILNKIIQKHKGNQNQTEDRQKKEKMIGETTKQGQISQENQFDYNKNLI